MEYPAALIRRILTLATLIIAAMVLAACAGDADGPAPTATGTSGESPTATSGPAATPTPGPTATASDPAVGTIDVRVTD